MSRAARTKTPVQEPVRPIDWAALRPKVTDALLQEMTQRIVEAFHPYKVILFGSYAYGTPHEDSDIDLLVIMDSEESMSKRMIQVREVAKIPFLPMDILVYTPEEIEQRLKIGDFFFIEILEKGKVLYARDAA